MKIHPLLKIFTLSLCSAVLAGIIVFAAMWGYVYFDTRLNGMGNYLTVTRVQYDLEKLRDEIVRRNRGLSDEEIQTMMDERLANAEKPVMDALRERIKGVGIRKFQVNKTGEKDLHTLWGHENEGSTFIITTRDNPFTPIPMKDLIRFAIENEGQGAGQYPVPIKISPIKGAIHYEPGLPFYFLTMPIVFFAVFFILLRKHLKNKAKLPTLQGIPTP